jgi:hypothetical protein
MAEAELAAITASGTCAPHRDQIGTVMITENPNLALASIAQRPGHDHSPAGALPVPMPKPEDHAADADGWGALWLSPGIEARPCGQAMTLLAAETSARLVGPGHAPDRCLSLLRHKGR